MHTHKAINASRLPAPEELDGLCADGDWEVLQIVNDHKGDAGGKPGSWVIYLRRPRT